ncbi:hypothetical protein V8C86DRAFT_1833810 [Haematococcus lacustris]
MHVTTAAAERNWSSWGNTYNAGRSQLNVATAEKMVYIRPTSPRLSQVSHPSCWQKASQCEACHVWV